MLLLYLPVSLLKLLLLLGLLLLQGPLVDLPLLLILLVVLLFSLEFSSRFTNLFPARSFFSLALGFMSTSSA